MDRDVYFLERIITTLLKDIEFLVHFLLTQHVEHRQRIIHDAVKSVETASKILDFLLFFGKRTPLCLKAIRTNLGAKPPCALNPDLTFSILE